MLTGIHILLTYKCNQECDHCFVYGTPRAEGTFTLSQLRAVFTEINKVKTVKRVYFEGGESFLYYPLLIEGIKMAHNAGLEIGIVTNAYWATTEDDAKLWLKPLHRLGVADLSISDDSFHSDKDIKSYGKNALKAAKSLGMNAGVICIEEPVVQPSVDKNQTKGEPIIGGDVVFRGRATEKLTANLPLKKWQSYTECPDEELENPKRVHVDAYGNVHICQGISIGNMWEKPLSKIINDYKCEEHPICRPIIRGGPSLLVKEYDLKHEEGYIDACHLCYLARKCLIDEFPEYLAPRQLYGL